MDGKISLWDSTHQRVIRTAPSSAIVRMPLGVAASGTVSLSAGLYEVSCMTGLPAGGRVISIGVEEGVQPYSDPSVAQPTFDATQLNVPSATASLSSRASVIVECCVACTLHYLAGANTSVLRILRLGDAP